MPAEAAFSITAKNANNDLCTLRGDTYPEFVANVQAAFGAHADSILARYASSFGASAAPASYEQAAVHNLQSQGVVATPPAVAPVSTVGQPLPVPQPGVPQPVAPAAAPPTAGYPGDCNHGRRNFKDSVARGKQWQRWECALDWQKGNDAHNAQRCKPVNV